jgi:hypothetical protein
MNKTGKNRKKPVETEERILTKRSERMKVKCGTVLRTRMNIGDFAYETGCGPHTIFRQARRAGHEIIIRTSKEQHTWQRE